MVLEEEEVVDPEVSVLVTVVVGVGWPAVVVTGADGVACPAVVVTGALGPG